MQFMRIFPRHKAFDRVGHAISLEKLKIFGIIGKVNTCNPELDS